jgi:hypothetical protein
MVERLEVNLSEFSHPRAENLPSNGFDTGVSDKIRIVRPGLRVYHKALTLCFLQPLRSICPASDDRPVDSVICEHKLP